MICVLRFIIAVVLAGITSITLADGTSTTSLTAASPASTPPSNIEVDIIFPVHNATYNVTEALPIAFVLQNLAAAAALAPFTFEWDIMPYGNVGENDQVPAGLVNDYARTTFTTANTTTEPYLFVNQTNVQKWRFGPMFPNGSVYALQWWISWHLPIQPCGVPVGFGLSNTNGTLFFNINLNSPEPDLANLIGQCPQLGNAYEINTTAKNSSCPAVVSDSVSTDTCAITMDQAVVGNISSAVQSLITASAAASSTSAALASATSTHSPAQHNIAVSSDVPLLYVVVATFLGSLQIVISL
jgi:hypothetical protein